MKIFEINYLIIIKINNNIREWVCNSNYGLYILSKIKRCKNPYSICFDEGKDFETKTISDIDDFDYVISRGTNEFEDLSFEIKLDDIYLDFLRYYNFEVLKSSKKYNHLLNLNDEVPNTENFDFLSKLFIKKNLLEEYIYVFGSKNIMNTENILDNLINVYNNNLGRFLYLDLEYLSKIKYRKDLKQYLAFWLPRAFHRLDKEKYISFYKSLEIDFEKYEYIIKKLIEFNNKNYEGEKLFIVVNNVNNNESHSIIDSIKKVIKEDCHHKFLIFCKIEDENNLEKFCEIYTKNDIKLILIPDLIFNEPINNVKKEMKKLFSEYDKDKFVDLFKIFHFSAFVNYKSEKGEKEFQEIDFIQKYIKFFNLNVENDLDKTKAIIKNIHFKSKDIEKQFYSQYEDYFLNSIETDEKLQAILNIDDVAFFGKLIILDNIIEKITENFIKYEINDLYRLNLENFEFEKYKGKNILFTQKDKTSEIFDFAILINQNGHLIMKLYQIITKKSIEDLTQLDVDIIKLHCINISKNLEKFGKIEKFSFGIIISSKCYEKNKGDYSLLKDDCKNKNFELLIYNMKEKKFYIEKDNIKNEKKNILLPLENIYSIEDTYNLDLPNYDSFFKLKPRLKTLKFLNKNYIHCIEKYYNTPLLSSDIKIIGKIDYDNSLISSSINDNNLGLLIAGYIPGKKHDKESNADINNDIDYRIVKECGENKIYKKNQKYKLVEKITEFNDTLIEPQVILYKINEKKFLKRKRFPENLFIENLSVLQKNN